MAKITTYCMNVDCLAVSGGKHSKCPHCGSKDVKVIKREKGKHIEVGSHG
ncbi:MAG: hypothetical protein ACXABY_27400 [Candidatus Thorarchaeota archaeon]|jgi:Zn finger protein HypA/HybF involved in hydrogenase expression